MSFFIQIDKQYLKFSSAHFTLFSDGRERLHGHNYAIRIEIETGSLQDGFVVNFVPLKKAAGAICDSLDEKILLPTHPRVRINCQGGCHDVLVDDADQYRFPSPEVVVLPIPNITCESLAWFIGGRLVEERGRWDSQNAVNRLQVWVEESPGQRGGYEVRLETEAQGGGPVREPSAGS